MATTKRKVIRKSFRKARKGIADTKTAKSVKAYDGAAMVSPWAVPVGGIKKSPAWRLVADRLGCGVNSLPPPESRIGAPIKGGFPVSRWPTNVLVDGERVFWLPDDFGQGVKNTGPGGTYIVWIGPQGKIYYHRWAIEQDLGRDLTALDGINGTLKKVKTAVKPDVDRKFFATKLTASERKHILPANRFHFAIVSARRADSNEGQQDILLVEAHFRSAGVTPTWYVDAASVDAYRALSLNAVVGGKLTPARNMALEDAARKNKICVQVSDDISLWEYYDIPRLKGPQSDFNKMNKVVRDANRKGKAYAISPVGAAQFILAKMRSSTIAAGRPQLGGVFPLANTALSVGQDEFTHSHFILGDFFVVDRSPCRFDASMTLKEDYDFTAAHLAEHGAVLRCNRMMLRVKRSTNAGGAVANRDGAGAEEQKNIAILQEKWPGAFMMNGRRKNEVIFTWHRHAGGEQKDPPMGGKKSGGVAKKVTKVIKKTLKKARPHEFPPAATLRYTGVSAIAEYITKRCKRFSGRTVQQCLGMKFDKEGAVKTYSVGDLRYDLATGRLQLEGGQAKKSK